MINNLASYRKKEKISQIDLANKLGIAVRTLSKYESPTFNLKELSIVELEKICEILNIKIRDLVEIL